MIWFEQAYDKPDGTAILRGNFRPDAVYPDHIVTITLKLRVDGDDVTRVLYSHNPGLGHEEPNSDEVYTKYAHKIRRAIEYVQKQPRCADMLEKAKEGRP